MQHDNYSVKHYIEHWPVMLLQRILITFFIVTLSTSRRL